MIDLHTHTTSSDGQYTPTELVILAAEKGITCLAITDHDTVAGIGEGRKAAQQYGMEFIPGIEISTKGNRELHMLGYGIDETNPVLLEACRRFQKYREERKYRILDFLEQKGVCISLEQVETYSSGGLVARPHFAQAMVEAGFVGSVREAFDRYLGTPEFDRVERPKPSPEEGIALIHRAGGKAVLAHPVQLKLEPEALVHLLEFLISAGLDGMECWYSTHTKEQSDFYEELADRYGLIKTGGSDFHGEKVKPHIELGISGPSLEGIKQWKESETRHGTLTATD